MKYLLLFTCFLFQLSVNGQNEYLDAEREREQRIKKYQDSIDTDRLDSLTKYQNLIFRNITPNAIYLNEVTLSDGYIYTAINIEVINTYKKKIKYITFNIQAYNRVDDLVGSLKKSKTIGPFTKNNIYRAEIDNIYWVNDFIEYCKIKSVDIHFFDNSILKNTKVFTSDDQTKINIEKYKSFQSDY